VKKSRYTDERIAFALRQTETGTPVKEVLRKMGISEQTFLPLEAALRRPGPERIAPYEAAGGGEPPSETDGGRSFPRQDDASGRALKKTLRPAHRRTLVGQLLEH